MNLFCVFHVFPKLYWKIQIHDKLTRMKKEGLFKEKFQINFTIIQPTKEDLTWLNLKIKQFTKNFNIYEFKENHVEFESIKLVKEISDKNHGYILYIHTKGCYSNKKMIMNILNWDEMMTFITIDNWKKCINKLKNYNCIGANFIYVSYIPKHFSGNFWWAKTDYLKKLDNIKLYKSRYEYEFWIGKNVSIEEMNPFCPYRSPFVLNNYEKPIQKEWYNNIDFETNYLYESTKVKE